MATEDEEFADERYAGDDDGKAGDEDAGGQESEEGLPGGRIPNPPPRDAWVSRVVEDPANPQPAVLLSGYVGDAADEGRTRIYTDASLQSYVEVQDEDVLHHEALGGDQVPEGGSMVWVRADALVTPGSTGGTGGGGAAGGDFFTGPVLEQNRKAGTAQKAEPVQITLLTIAGCHTQQFACTIFGCVTQNLLCKTAHPIICSHVCQQGGEGQREPVGPTGYFHCGELVGVTGWQGCGEEGREPVDTYTCPPSIGCIGVTGWQGCGQEGTGAGGWGAADENSSIDCPSVDPTKCPQPPNFTAHIYPDPAMPMMGGGGPGPTAWHGCGQQGPIGITGWQGCGQPSQLIGCTGWMGCGPGPVISIHAACPSAIDACPTRFCGGREGTDTVQAAAQPQNFAAAAPQAAPPTFRPHCPDAGGGAGGGVGGAMGGGAAAAGPSTEATVCTQLGCPRTITCPPTFQPGCGPDHEHGGSTAATICTQVPFCPPTTVCPPVTMERCGGGGGYGGGATGLVCVRTSTCPPSIYCTPFTMAGCAGGAELAAVPTGQYAPQCPTFGIACTYVHCPPATVGFACPPQTGYGCPNTSTCPVPTMDPGCPETSTCPPITVGPGCPNTSTCPVSAGLPGADGDVPAGVAA